VGLKAVCSKPFSSPSIDFISSRAFRRTSFNLSWILFDWRAPQFYIYIPLFQNTKCCHGWRGLTCYINSLARCDLHDNLHIVRNRGIRQPGPKPINHLPELFSVPGSIRTHNWDFPFIFWNSSMLYLLPPVPSPLIGWSSWLAPHLFIWDLHTQNTLDATSNRPTKFLVPRKARTSSWRSVESTKSILGI